MNWGEIRDNSIPVTGTYSQDYALPGVEAGGSSITQDDPAEVEVDDLPAPAQVRLPTATLPLPGTQYPRAQQQSQLPMPSWMGTGAKLGSAVARAMPAASIPVSTPPTWAKPVMIAGVAALVIFGLYYWSNSNE